MKKLMKFASMAMVGLFALAPIMHVDAMTKFTSDDWNNEDGTYGSFTKVDDNITNLKGNATDTKGQYYGPYSKSSTDTLEDGTITEEVNVELDPEGWAQAEYFTLAVALNDDADKYVVENGIWSQKDGDAIYVYSSWDPENKIKVTEKGVYTFQYTYTKDADANKVYFDFNLKLWDEVIGGFYNVDMDEEVLHMSGDTQKPVADHAFDIRYVWFDNITVADGINVYTNLPEKPVDPEVPVTSVEPETPAEEVKNEENPETSDGIVLFLGLTVVGFVGTALAYRRLHN